MRKVKIKASAPLFNKWKEIVGRINKVANLVDKSCSPLFETNKEVSIEGLIKWKDEIIPMLLEELDARKSDITKLVEISRSYIKATQ